MIFKCNLILASLSNKSMASLYNKYKSGGSLRKKKKIRVAKRKKKKKKK